MIFGFLARNGIPERSIRMKSAIRARLAGWRHSKPVAISMPGMPYALLAVLAATFPWSQTDRTGVIADVSLCVGTALWMLFMYTLRPAWRQQTPYMRIYVAGLIVLTGALVDRDGWFGFFDCVCYGACYSLLRWPWQLIGVTGISWVAAMSQAEGVDGSLLVKLLFFFLALAIDLLLFSSLMWLLHDRNQQLEEHQAALTELNAANQRLEATIAENEDLHQRLVAQAREAGTLDERRRMAREIHDTLAQGLIGIVTQLQAAEQAAAQTPGDQTGWQRHVTAATQLARESLTEARRSVDALRPEPLDGCRLSEALSGVAERWSALNGISAQVTTTGTARPVDPEIEFALLRAVQESLANVARHAHASRVGVTVSYMENEVAVDVRDDGAGFEPSTMDHGFGLVAMRQRIAALSGTVQVESEPGGGTAISACAPTVSGLVRS
jgi:signal transduction histidine kinase